jgi:diguanylate cyclase (GGDEF)-like protein
MLLEPLVQMFSVEDVQELLLRAGDTRTIEEITDVTSWSSYHQFRRLLEEAKVTTESAANPGQRGIVATMIGNTEIVETTQAFGSPASVLGGGTDLNPMVPIRRYDTNEVTPNEWTIREWFVDGYEPYPEYCEFAAGQYAQIPTIFGLPLGEITEEECQCRGDAACLFRMRWAAVDDETSRTEYLEVRTHLLEVRLEQLQDMIADLASNERYEDVLMGIVNSSLRATGAVGVLMALEPRPGSPRKLYSKGLTDDEAQALADQTLGGDVDRKDLSVVPVASARRHYGVLAVDGRGSVFTSNSSGTLETYARLAAATLDAADALEDARRQANTAQVLLELSTSLAQIVSAAEMAAKVARAVPALIDCDQVAVFLDAGSVEEGTTGYQLAASVGYSDEDVAFMGARTFTQSETDVVSEFGLIESSASQVGAAANLSAPIMTAGETIGYIAAGVTSDPDRLAITSHLADRLKALAAQAGIAINNARLVDQIRFQAVHDALTGLPNRALILDRTEQMLARSRRSYVPVAALFIDLDGFKDVNDTLGHGVGDQLLQAVTARLSSAMRESDSVGRLGGDEFVVLVDGSTMDAGPELVAERLLEILQEPYDLNGTVCGPLSLTASIGIASGNRPSATELLRDADIALYQAKAAGKNRFVVFQPEMHAAVQDRHLLEMDLHDALRDHQYFLVYQPIFNLRSGETTGVESLLRWRHPERGIVQPDSFIPLLEDSGMIIDVGRWVVWEACRQGALWHAMGHHLDVSVNVSARQLETDSFVDDVRGTLRVSGFDPRSLILEITETAIMKNVAEVIPRLTALKALGMRIAIDDFGTGYSSLAYLQQFPVDTLKIDRSFISTMSESPESGALIHTLVQLGKTLGLETLAEGIEETDQCSTLQREQCDSGQGYLYARPLDAEAVEVFLANQFEERSVIPAVAEAVGTA